MISNGACNSGTAVKIERGTAEETDDAADSYCTLPAAAADDYRTSTCTALSSGMKIDGVGLYYDDRCNTVDLTGCRARSVAGCRLCFVDKEQWLARFPFDRVPDWELCPCCVADNLEVDCTTGGGGGGNDEGVIIGVSVAIAGVIAIACCLSCAFGTTIVRFVSVPFATATPTAISPPDILCVYRAVAVAVAFFCLPGVCICSAEGSFFFYALCTFDVWTPPKWQKRVMRNGTVFGGDG